MLKKTESAISEMPQLDAIAGNPSETQAQPIEHVETHPPGSADTAIPQPESIESATLPPLAEPEAPTPKRATVTYLPFVSPNPSNDEPDPADGGNGNDAALPPKPKSGSVMLNSDKLRMLRQQKMLSQEELVNDFQRRQIQISIVTIKRAECGHRVRYRIVREFANYFGVAVSDLLPA